MNQNNAELQLAADFVAYTNRHIFLTGRAGTGKTTFLRNLANITGKRMVVTAPTGVAAINAGGVTLHSFFQLPFGLFIPGAERQNEQPAFQIRKQKMNLIRSIDLLVIDEISMVRADLLDAVDEVLRRIRRSNKPFGGVQLLMIGDLHQLSPVARDDEWAILRQHYETVFFFSSHALKRTDWVSVELKQIFRQTDQHFIDLLNAVRDNRLDAQVLKTLNERYRPDFRPDDNQGYITLSTHNHVVDQINAQRLGQLPGASKRFEATITGTFPEYSYPTNASLELKTGAQVMFVKNDASAEKRYFNGKIGKLLEIYTDRLVVLCPGDTDRIDVEVETWENSRYTLNTETQTIEQEVVGSFQQFPLRLAWAITIHKSQGLTFDRAIIDAQSAFAHGQVYVALSRCRSLEGLVLSSLIGQQAVRTDQSVGSFVQRIADNPPSVLDLQRSKTLFEQNLLVECFSTENTQQALRKLMTLQLEHPNTIRYQGVDEMELVELRATSDVFEVADKFVRFLQSRFQPDASPLIDPQLQDRVRKAVAYFVEKIDLHLMPLSKNWKVLTDNKLHKKKAEELHKEYAELATALRAGVQAAAEGFDPDRYLRAIRQTEKTTEKPTEKQASASKKETKSANEYTEADLVHTSLFESLRTWRNTLAAEQGVAPYVVMHQRPLIQVAVAMPQSLDELLLLPGFGKGNVGKYGQQIVSMVVAYRQANGLEHYTAPAPKSAATDGSAGANRHTSQGQTVNSPTISQQMYLDGVEIADIAERRGLARTTIAAHLAEGIERGEISLLGLMTAETEAQARAAFAAVGGSALRPVREHLSDAVEYETLHFVRARLRFEGKLEGAKIEQDTP